MLDQIWSLVPTAEVIHGLLCPREIPPLQPLPSGITVGVEPRVYDAYREGCDGACADVIIGTYLPNGEPAVCLSVRKETSCFGNLLWMQGGAIEAYQNIEASLQRRVLSESGIRITSLSKVGTYRTCSPKKPGRKLGSTLQVCYATIVPYSECAHMRTDSGHSSIRLFCREELDHIPVEQKHWYPLHVAHYFLNILYFIRPIMGPK